jgi:hypothetical protein
MGSGVTEWRQREVFEAIAADVQETMEIAAKVVETDARRRLLRIREPDFGRKYRMVLALYRLTSFVRREGKAIVGKIGIPAGEKGGDYGFWIEIGSKTAPAQPWIRPALIENLRNIVRLFNG